MKNGFILLALALCPLAASASCLSGGPDNGYIVTFSADGKKAQVGEETIAGPRNLKTLDCRNLPAPHVMAPDMLIATKFCRESGIADAGYMLTLSHGGFAGITQVKLEEETIAGPQELATLICN